MQSHTIHGAFETGVVKSGWNLKKLLKGAFHILHDTPARQDDYDRSTGSTILFNSGPLDGWMISQ